MRAVLVLLMLSACDTPYEPPVELPAIYTTCEAPTDCVIVQLTCCDACNGGTEVAARADQRSALMDELGESCGNGTFCTEIGCAPSTADCVDNECVLVLGSF